MYGNGPVARQLCTRHFVLVRDLENVQAREATRHFLNQERYKHCRQHVVMHYLAEMLYFAGLQWRVESQCNRNIGPTVQSTINVNKRWPKCITNGIPYHFKWWTSFNVAWFTILYVCTKNCIMLIVSDITIKNKQ